MYDCLVIDLYIIVFLYDSRHIFCFLSITLRRHCFIRFFINNFISKKQGVMQFVLILTVANLGSMLPEHILNGSGYRVKITLHLIPVFYLLLYFILYYFSKQPANELYYTYLFYILLLCFGPYLRATSNVVFFFVLKSYFQSLVYCNKLLCIIQFNFQYSVSSYID